MPRISNMYTVHVTQENDIATASLLQLLIFVIILELLPVCAKSILTN